MVGGNLQDLRRFFRKPRHSRNVLFPGASRRQHNREGGWEKTLRGEPLFLRHRILRGDETRWVEERGEVESDSGGKPVAGLGTVRDITLFLRLLRQFVDEHGKDGSRIEDDLAAGALESAGKRARGLRGVSAGPGLETGNAVAAKIEKQVRNKHPAEEILPLAESLEPEIGRFAARLADFRAEEEPGKR